MPRKYEQRRRAESAAKTRKRILDAVYEALIDAPAEDVNVNDIARRAGVARSTVYTVFADRSELFDEFALDVLRRGGFDELLAAADSREPIAAVEETIRFAVQVYSEHRVVLRSLYSRAQLDPNAFSGAIERLEAGRRRGMRDLAVRLEREKVLPRTATVDRATDILWMLTAFDTFDLLSTGRSLLRDEIVSTLLLVAEQALLQRPQ